MKKETKKNKAASASAETATNKNVVSKPDATDTTTHTMDVPTDVEKGINDLKASYDTFLYISKPFSSTNINNLYAKAKIYGLNPVAPSKARVLELGASCGGNIIPQAMYYPKRLSQASTYPAYRWSTARRSSNPSALRM